MVKQAARQTARQFGTSQPGGRLEDERLLRGQGRFVADRQAANQAYVYFVRAPVAHATNVRIGLDAAREAEGVLAVFSNAELEADRVAPFKCGGELPPSPATRPMSDPESDPDGRQERISSWKAAPEGRPMFNPGRPLMVADRIRHAGEILAMLVAESPKAAQDAAELVEVDFDELPAVTDTARTLRADSPRLYEDLPDNIAFEWEHRNTPDIDTVFEKAARVLTIELINNRIIVNPLETRGVLADPCQEPGRLLVVTNTQGVWPLQKALAERLTGGELSGIRVLTEDVGGGFGLKGLIHVEQLLVPWAAQKLGRPLRWIADRQESFLADNMGRDNVSTAHLALDADHRILGLKIVTLANMGAYLSEAGPDVPTACALTVATGVYDIPALQFHVKGVFTNTTSVDAYRGAGRPESIYLIERLMDRAARVLSLDPADFREKNMVTQEQMPYDSATGEHVDSGDFAGIMKQALQQADRAGFPERRAQSAQRGLWRGFGFCTYLETTMGRSYEDAIVHALPDGGLEIFVGTQSNGQGHHTTFAEILHTKLGVPMEKIRYVEGDTDRVPDGGGTAGSRSATVQSMALIDAAADFVERGKVLSARFLNASEADIEFHEGTFRVKGTDRSLTLGALVQRAQSDGLTADLPDREKRKIGPLYGAARHQLSGATYPNGCHVAEIELDPQTGIVTLVRYVVVDDIGTLLNPTLVEGQVQGGIAQGIGQALLEHTVYDANGQLASGSFMDYAMPRAVHMPMIEFSTRPTMCQNNALGMKGCGEAGTIGACAAVMNALADALAPHGVECPDMPATPLRIWTAIQAASGKTAKPATAA